MSQVTISQQDLQAINVLTQTIIPKIILRIKDLEATNSEQQQQLIDIKQQLSVLHQAAPKKEVRTRKGKNKVAEVPPLVQILPPVQPALDTAVESPLDQQTQTEAAAIVASSAPGNPVAGTAVVTQSDVSETGASSSAPAQDNRHGAGTPNDPANGGIVPPSEPTVIEGIAIDGRAIQAVHYCLQQNVTTPAEIAQALQCPEAPVQWILDMSVEAQAEVMQLFPAQ